ncbi:hypothetical protein F441_00931 [Phytophthora nicotianae CJ01A1]|uniref:PHD-type domain-containing protein n=3 Tax=Phytophthora nicotianae TaxID=4792 RepID=W3A411_PHYNI|nr:hypothetical protein L915_00896 [Phytophthora nicotianae]ETL49683.1 hypothetical protein L916_00884 [Phytophthora nicotianae]ETM02757.1 hypothetical protein L917_00851 [Phytophthora nicotianae]ETP26324.1 hypothetical protein F441_00931 [Phytophthora nicotianae CJ01A1]ETP54352.1 hypothetical protein F442_00909 [Phytophthora nicotianae P10297]
MPSTASGSSLVTRTRADHASSRAAPGRPFRVGSDGLPLLPCHDAPVSVMPASSPPPAVTLFGNVDTKQNVRTQLLARYSSSKQLDQVSEMTLRIDTELELLRRSCFAQRNAQWANITPDQFEYKPTPIDSWTPQPANDKLLLRKMRMEGTLDGSGREFYPPVKTHDQEMLEFVRDRPWPPQEFALKPVAKPSRGRGGKRKAAPMAAVLDPVPLLAKTCRECKTQSTPLWRTQTRTVKVKKQVLKNTAGNDATNLANAFVAQSMAKIDPQRTELKVVEEKIEVDLCLKCYLKLERADLFDKKRMEKKKQERRKKDQAAAAALQEKKRLKHQIHLLKKHKKQEMLAAQQAAGEQMTEQVQEEAAAPAAVILKFTREEIEAATASSKERKKDRKHSRKDKKKKKKKHRRQREYHEESESDCPTPIPSPAQMNGYIYADRAPEPYAPPQVSAFEAEQAHEEPMAVNTEPEAVNSGLHEDEKEVFTPARSSSRKRKSVQYTEPAVEVESPASASKKRKTSSSRSSRSKRTTTSASPAPAVVAVPSTPSVKKRSRTKKELARERELRALGQYCPVCNEVYEDDDQNTFVCCDSCELWVHGACDPSLTPYVGLLSMVRVLYDTDVLLFLVLCVQSDNCVHGQHRR